MVVEITVGIGMGLAIGIGLDELLGTQPLFLLLMLLLGFAAGMRLAIASAQEVSKGKQDSDAETGET